MSYQLSKKDVKTITEKLKQMAEVGKSPIEIAVESARLRNVAAQLVSTVTDEAKQRKIYGIYFIDNALADLKSQGRCDEELESYRISAEIYVNKLMEMTPLERFLEFERLDRETISKAESQNDGVVFDYLLSRLTTFNGEVIPEDELESFRQEKKIQYIIGSFDFSEEERANAIATLRYLDKTKGYRTLIDLNGVETTNEKLTFIKTQLDLQELSGLKKNS